MKGEGTMKITYDKYTVCDCAGTLHTLKVPTLLSNPYEVAERLHHAEVFLHVPAKHKVYARQYPNCDEALIEGPATVFVSKANGGGFHQVPNAPRDEKEVYMYYRTMKAAGAQLA